MIKYRQKYPIDTFFTDKSNNFFKIAAFSLNIVNNSCHFTISRHVFALMAGMFLKNNNMAFNIFVTNLSLSKRKARLINILRWFFSQPNSAGSKGFIILVQLIFGPFSAPNRFVIMLNKKAFFDILIILQMLPRHYFT